MRVMPCALCRARDASHVNDVSPAPRRCREVERLAALSGISLRSGCMCNPGGCAAAVGLTAEEVAANYEGGHVCGDERDIINGKPTGLVRCPLPPTHPPTRPLQAWSTRPW